MASVGQELKRERELRGISLKEISDATKINFRFLRDLEEDRLDNLPGKFFTKSMIRAYAQYIGLEEDYILNIYYETTKIQEPDQIEEEEEEKESKAVMPRNIKNIIYFVSAFIILTGILSIMYFVLQDKVEEPPLKTVPTTTIVQVEQPPPVTEPVEEVSGINMEIDYQMDTWIQVYADGALVLEAIRIQGDSDQIQAEEEILIHTGNAGGFFFRLNGKAAKPLGRSGSVRRNVIISTENIQQFLKEEEAPLDQSEKFI